MEALSKSQRMDHGTQVHGPRSSFPLDNVRPVTNDRDRNAANHWNQRNVEEDGHRQWSSSMSNDTRVPPILETNSTYVVHCMLACLVLTLVSSDSYTSVCDLSGDVLQASDSGRTC